MELKSKYGNKKTIVDGIKFHSKREAERYSELKLLEKTGQIRDLCLQPKFNLVASQRNADGKAERAVEYVGDFMYLKGGRCVVEDVKGVRTRDYIIKRKLMLERHGVTVKEVE